MRDPEKNSVRAVEFRDDCNSNAKQSEELRKVLIDAYRMELAEH